MKKSIGTLFFIALIFTCFSMHPAYTAAADEKVTLQHDGKPFEVSIGEFDKDEDGNTTVEIRTNFEVTTPDFNPSLVMDIVNETIRVKIVAEGKTLDSFSFTVKAGGLNIHVENGNMLAKVDHIAYHFKTTALPEEITVYNGESSGATFDGKTKKTVK